MVKRDVSVEVIKFIAALTITWSHMEPLLPDYRFLATGGAIGDALFFFCSGYTLFLGRGGGSFFSWYKRRINRIYPTVFAWALLSSVIWGTGYCMRDVILSGGGFFVSCIMVFYIPLYFLRNHLSSHLWQMALVSQICCMVAFLFVDHDNFDSHYRWSWSFYFIVMLFGAILGKLRKEGTLKIEMKTWKGVALLSLGTLTYYAISFVCRHYGISFLESVYDIPLIAVCYGTYIICNAERIKNLMNRRKINTTVKIIGGLCLEIYIVQPSLLSDRLNAFFPVNILIVFLLIFFVAYMLRCIARLWSQTFREGDYDVRAIFKLY